MKNNYLLLKKRFLLLLFIILSANLSAFAQSSNVTGTVKDETGEVVPGATVMVKGTQVGTVTDIDGVFNIQAAPGSILVVSFIGYTPSEVAVQSGQTTYDITINTSMSDLSEVVVVGYGSQIKKEVTGAIQSISEDELKDMPVTTTAQKLQGKLAGVQINQTTGKPGQGMNVRIRGQLSVSGGSDPLYVVDGFPITGDINTLNPDEIQDITILKDAASTSLYGSRAANGVVLITTKRGKVGQTNVTLNVYTGFQKVPEQGRLEMLTAEEFAQFKKEYYTDAGQPVPAIFQNPADFRGKNNDWYGAMLETAPITNYNLTITSNKEKVNTAIVAGVFDQKGVVRNTDYERYSIRMNTDYTVSDKVSIGLNVAPSYIVDNTPQTDGSRGTGILFNALHTWPVMDIYDENGDLTFFNRFPAETGNIFAYPNWLRSADEITNQTKRVNILANTYAEWRPIKGLSLKSTFNTEIRNSNYFFFNPSTATNQINVAIPTVAVSIRDNFRDFSWLNENIATYTNNIGDHNFEILAGFSNQQFRRDRTRVQADTYADDRLPTIQGAININRGGTISDVDEWTLTSVFSRLTYNFKGKYLFTAAVRGDGSSRFGADNRWGIFPSTSVGWVLSDENFLNTSSTVSFMKLRASFGVTGNNNIGNYTQYALVNNTINAAFDNNVVPGAAVTSLSNTNLGWETTAQFDIGLDLGLWEDRVTFGYDYYTKNTTNLLYAVQVPQESGFTNFNDNIGEIKFWGHEFTVNAVIAPGAFRWSVNANLSINRNEVLELADGIDRVYGFAHITQVGQPFGQFYGLNKLGNYANAEDLANSPVIPGRSTVGSIKLEDVNGDGVITFGGDNDDRTIIGNPFPDFVYGFTNNFKWKNWDASIVASGSQGNQLYMRHLYSTANLDGVFNMVAKVKDRFRSPENPGEGIFGTTVGGGNVTGIERDWPNSNFVWDASYFTIRNITLGYTFTNLPKSIKSARLYASGQNMWVFTKYWGGSNPEVSMQNNGQGDGGNLSPGVDLAGYPVPRTITFGVNITF
ncbi:TonB-linked SusC/RagA family outer membrane protein [Algoriphagus iocasae]|jgi:TonB-dependent starch-binding outer membrane protein SusC|uniref:TonB-linked SusC/RagA family outer membrane protein n=1 Tax=Algoriphagus iocasae TaxID=1836499 RepID=A0A841MT13_9BACT|nr:TonB-dependent receptor [Algoriphagus iocasae]MBB6328879.1 TonB-linked SusC/RagA family outer membrane protein [Algoriphagus iocasae]